jgi:hypothetical protein
MVFTARVAFKGASDGDKKRSIKEEAKCAVAGVPSAKAEQGKSGPVTSLPFQMLAEYTMKVDELCNKVSCPT